MPKLLSSIIKQKKIIIFVVLGLVISSIFFSSSNNIFAQGPSTNPISGTAESASIIKKIDPCKEIKENLSWYKQIGVAFIDVITYIPKQLARLTTWLASLAISKVTNWPITHTQPGEPIAGAKAFLNGWTSVRDLANMLVVLGFVIIGIATTLRIRDYEAKKFLLPLILAALLVNFSGLFVGLIIDASTLTMNGLLQGGTSGTMGTTFFSNIQEKEIEIGCESLKNDSLTTYSLEKIEFTLIYLAVAVAFIYLAFILIARYAVLGILFMLSPLAFVFWAFPFPKAKDLWNKWWESFIKWAFIGVGIAFFLNITAQMLATFPLKEPKDFTVGNMFFYLTIVLIFLVVGIKITTKTSAIGAAAVMGLASGGIGLAMGAAAGLAKVGGKGLMAGADKMSRGKLSGAGQAIKGGVGRTMERMSWLTGRKEGTTAMKEGAAIAEEQKRHEAMFKSGNAADKARAIQAAKTGRGRNKAGAIAAAVATENINDVYKDSAGNIDTEAMNRGLGFAEKFGAGENLRKNAEKQNWQLAGEDPKKVRKELGALGLPTSSAIGSPDYARAQSSVNMKQLEKVWGNLNTEDRAKIDLSTLHSEDAQKFLLSNRGHDLISANMFLPTTSTTRINNATVANNIIGANPRSNQSDLDVATNGYTGPARVLDDALEIAYNTGDTNTQRELRKIRNKIRGL